MRAVVAVCQRLEHALPGIIRRTQGIALLGTERILGGVAAADGEHHWPCGGPPACAGRSADPSSSWGAARLCRRRQRIGTGDHRGRQRIRNRRNGAGTETGACRRLFGGDDCGVPGDVAFLQDLRVAAKAGQQAARARRVPAERHDTGRSRPSSLRHSRDRRAVLCRRFPARPLPAAAVRARRWRTAPGTLRWAAAGTAHVRSPVRITKSTIGSLWVIAPHVRMALARAEEPGAVHGAPCAQEARPRAPLPSAGRLHPAAPFGCRTRSSRV